MIIFVPPTAIMAARVATQAASTASTASHLSSHRPHRTTIVRKVDGEVVAEATVTDRMSPRLLRYFRSWL